MLVSLAELADTWYRSELSALGKVSSKISRAIQYVSPKANDDADIKVRQKVWGIITAINQMVTPGSCTEAYSEVFN
jgi:hypothetical protein